MGYKNDRSLKSTSNIAKRCVMLLLVALLAIALIPIKGFSEQYQVSTGGGQPMTYTVEWEVQLPETLNINTSVLLTVFSTPQPGSAPGQKNYGILEIKHSVSGGLPTGTEKSFVVKNSTGAVIGSGTGSTINMASYVPAGATQISYTNGYTQGGTMASGVPLPIFTPTGTVTIQNNIINVMTLGNANNGDFVTYNMNTSNIPVIDIGNCLQTYPPGTNNVQVASGSSTCTIDPSKKTYKRVDTYVYQVSSTETWHAAPKINGFTPSPDKQQGSVPISASVSLGTSADIIKTANVDAYNPYEGIEARSGNSNVVLINQAGATSPFSTWNVTGSIPLNNNSLWTGVGSANLSYTVTDWSADSTRFSRRITVRTNVPPSLVVNFAGTSTPYDGKWLTTNPQSINPQQLRNVDITARSFEGGTYDLAMRQNGVISDYVSVSNNAPGSLKTLTKGNWSVANTSVAGEAFSSILRQSDDWSKELSPESTPIVSVKYDSGSPVILSANPQQTAGVNDWSLTPNVVANDSLSGVQKIAGSNNPLVYWQFVEIPTVGSTNPPAINGGAGWNTSYSAAFAAISHTALRGYDLYAFVVDQASNHSTPYKVGTGIRPTLPLFTVTFVDFDGTVLKTEIVAFDGTATAPTSPTRAGHTFTGWDKAFDHITQDTTITALYDINLFTVTFVDFDGTVLKTEIVAFDGTATAPSSPTRAGHTFTGWDRVLDHITQDTTITALYDINLFTVTFVDFDGTVLKTEIVAFDGTATAPSSPSRVGHTFTGWDKAFDHITQDTTITALYDINL
ncbi:MAG: InlB B-repeat-containing protein, partial [Coriobacteriales bacterium]|nr:InlB B-repeat-containing protein [Coriobacteriales bacterium]